ncbi:hypothetical protein JXB12_11605 [candidate division KSB1 bacterium]|nr:hypothetical protein [candidate division KSB1 bacterium]
MVKNKNEVSVAKPEIIPMNYAVQGTPIWGFNKFKQDALVKLMNDLYGLRKNGITPEQCQIITNALESISFSLSEIPDDFLFRGSIMSAFDDFKEEYIRWNEVQGNTVKDVKERQKILNKMKKRRHKLATITRRNQYIISKNLDLKLVEDIYKALGNIPNALPDLFVNLGSAINDFLNKEKSAKS